MVERVAQTIQFFLESFGCLRRIRRRHERARRELLVSKGAVKPDSKFSRNLEGAQRFGVIAGMAVGGAVTGDAELMKEIANFARNDAVEL